MSDRGIYIHDLIRPCEQMGSLNEKTDEFFKSQ